MAHIIKRGILQSFDPATYTASVLLIEATSAFLTGVPVSNSIDSSSAVPNAFCAVLFFDEHNYTDAVIIAVYPNGSIGVPSPAPGRVVLVPQVILLNGVAKPVGTSSIAIAGANGVPATAKAVLVSAIFYSATTNAFCEVYPFGGNALGYITLFEPAVNIFIAGAAIIPLGSNGGVGSLSLTIGTAAGTVYLYVYGYI